MISCILIQRARSGFGSAWSKSLRVKVQWKCQHYNWDECRSNWGGGSCCCLCPFPRWPVPAAVICQLDSACSPPSNRKMIRRTPIFPKVLMQLLADLIGSPGTPGLPETLALLPLLRSLWQGPWGHPLGFSFTLKLESSGNDAFMRSALHLLSLCWPAFPNSGASQALLLCSQPHPQGPWLRSTPGSLPGDVSPRCRCRHQKALLPLLINPKGHPQGFSDGWLLEQVSHSLRT